MKYTIRKSIRISKSIKNAWQIMEQEEEVTPFLYYDFMKHVYWQTMLFSLWSPMIYYITDERNRILLIAPMKHHIFSARLIPWATLASVILQISCIQRSWMQPREKSVWCCWGITLVGVLTLAVWTKTLKRLHIYKTMWGSRVNVIAWIYTLTRITIITSSRCPNQLNKI